MYYFCLSMVIFHSYYQKKTNCSSVYSFLVYQSIFKLNKYRRVILNCPIGRYGSMQGGVPSLPHLMKLNDKNYQLYSGVERGMLPPQESIVTRNYYSGPSAPYAPPVLQQYASSEAVIQEGTSSMSFEYSLVRRLGLG